MADIEGLKAAQGQVIAAVSRYNLDAWLGCPSCTTASSGKRGKGLKLGLAPW